MEPDQRPDPASEQTFRANPKLATLALIPSAVAFNVAVGLMAHVVKAPLYLDCIGVIATVLMVGWRAGLLVGVLSFAISAAIANPQVIFFAGTPVAISFYTYLLGKRGAFRTMPRTIVTGIGMGLLAGVISAPVVALLFGGVTSAGSSIVTSFFLATGKSLLQSVALSGAVCEPIDKVAQCLIAVWLVRSVPHDLLARFQGGVLHQNLPGFDRDEHSSA